MMAIAPGLFDEKHAYSVMHARIETEDAPIPHWDG